MPTTPPGSSSPRPLAADEYAVGTFRGTVPAGSSRRTAPSAPASPVPSSRRPAPLPSSSSSLLPAHVAKAMEEVASLPPPPSRLPVPSLLPVRTTRLKDVERRPVPATPLHPALDEVELERLSVARIRDSLPPDRKHLAVVKVQPIDRDGAYLELLARVPVAGEQLHAPRSNQLRRVEAVRHVRQDARGSRVDATVFTAPEPQTTKAEPQTTDPAPRSSDPEARPTKLQGLRGAVYGRGPLRTRL